MFGKLIAMSTTNYVRPKLILLSLPSIAKTTSDEKTTANRLVGDGPPIPKKRKG